VGVVEKHSGEIADGRTVLNGYAFTGENVKKHRLGSGKFLMRPSSSFAAAFEIAENSSVDVVILLMKCDGVAVDMSFDLCNFSALRWLILSENCSNCRTSLETFLRGRGANSAVKIFFHGDGGDGQNFRLSQTHVAAESVSTALCKTFLDGNAAAEFNGEIILQEGAENSDASQRNDSVLFSPNAKATSCPNLDIANSNVRCSHGATVGSLDGDLLFYMKSRGLCESDCKDLLVECSLLSMLR
jgi:Fe-S cluster assembly protein SufD